VELFVQAKSSPPEANHAGSEKRNIKKTKLKENNKPRPEGKKKHSKRKPPPEAKKNKLPLIKKCTHPKKKPPLRNGE
jgi:hypothetical protein